MGLACSKSIVQHMGGDIILKESTYGLTVFGFRIPVSVKIQELNQQKQSASINLNMPRGGSKNDHVMNIVMGKPRSIHHKLKEYLIKNNLIERESSIQN